MQWLAASGLSVFFLLVLFCVYQYQAHNRTWGLLLIADLGVLAILAAGTATEFDPRPEARLWERSCYLWAHGRHPEAAGLARLLTVRYPESRWIGPAWLRLADFRFEARDYAGADRLMERLWEYVGGGGSFPDSILIRWVLTAYKMGDYAKAKEKAEQLVCEYPESRYAATAKEIIKRLEAKLAREQRHRLTALHEAAGGGDAPAAAALLASGAEINARDAAGQTPLDRCQTDPAVPVANRAAVEELLRQHGGQTGAELDAAARPVAPAPDTPGPSQPGE